MASSSSLHTEDMAALLSAAKDAVRRAARLSVRVQKAMTDSDKLVKSDASPVTVADYGCQAIVSSVLKHSLGGFRLMAEEDAETLRSAGETLLSHVVNAVRDADAAEVEGALAGSSGWTADSVLSAIAAGTHGGKAEDGSYWVLDPIDGTKGFLRRGQYAVGLAYVSGGQVQLAAIACPNLPYPSWWHPTTGQAVCTSTPAGACTTSGAAVGTLFYAVKGQGAFMEGLAAGLGPVGVTAAGAAAGATSGNTAAGSTGAAASTAEPVRIRVNTVSDLARSILCESFDPGHSNHDVSAKVAALLGLPMGHGGQQDGHAAAGAAATSAPAASVPEAPGSSASGSGHGPVIAPSALGPIRMDSMCKYGLLARGDGSLYLRLPRPGYVENVWDHAPGSLLLTEAGGTVTDASGKALDFSLGRGLSANYGVVASNGLIHDRVLAALKSVRGE